MTFPFVVSGQKVFEWDQTLEEVNIYITLPPNVPTKLFHCKIQPKHVEVGIKGNPPYLNVRNLSLHTFVHVFLPQLRRIYTYFPCLRFFYNSMISAAP